MLFLHYFFHIRCIIYNDTACEVTSNDLLLLFILIEYTNFSDEQLDVLRTLPTPSCNRQVIYTDCLYFTNKNTHRSDRWVFP